MKDYMYMSDIMAPVEAGSSSLSCIQVMLRGLAASFLARMENIMSDEAERLKSYAWESEYAHKNTARRLTSSEKDLHPCKKRDGCECAKVALMVSGEKALLKIIKIWP